MYSLLLLVLPAFVLAVCPSCQQQCPCASQATTSAPVQKPCIGFDTRYMAATIDEAMFSFPNLVSNQGKPLFDESSESQSSASAAKVSAAGGGAGAAGDTMSTASIMSGPVPYSASIAQQQGPAKSVNRFVAPASESSCVSQECMSCKLAIIDGFLGDSQPDNADTLWLAKVHLQQETGLSAGTCGGAENVPPTTTKRPPKEWQKRNEKRAKEILNILATFGRKKRAIPLMPLPIVNSTSSPTNSSSSTTSAPPTNSTQSTPDALLGVTTQIGCDYRRGSALTSNAGFSGLCNLCWQWRRLPDEYFPTYVNEVACDKSDCGCLSGFGTCTPVTRVLNVVKNTGTKTNPTWVQTTIDTVAACECQVALTSPLLSFVAK